MTVKKNKERHPEQEAEGRTGDQMLDGSGSLPKQERPDGDGADPTFLPDELIKQLAEAQSQAAEFKDGWQRALADFQNYKRRTDAEKVEAYQNAIGTVVRRYLPILDDLERALAQRPADLPWANGVELICRKLQTILENEGVKRMEVLGQPFDPHFHEAIGQEAVEGVESGTIIDVVQQGYLLGERVVRPAIVRVAQ